MGKFLALMLFLALLPAGCNAPAATPAPQVAAAPSSTPFILPPTWTPTPITDTLPAAEATATLTRTPLGYADSPTPRPTQPTQTPVPSATPLNLAGLDPDQVTELAFQAFARQDNRTLERIYGDAAERNKYITLYSSLSNAIAQPYYQKGLRTLEKWYVLKRYKADGSPIYFSLVISCWKEEDGCWQQNFSLYYDAPSKQWLIFEHMHVIEPSQHPAP